MSNAKDAKRTAMAAGLRKLADDIERGALPLPYDVTVNAFWHTNERGRIGERLELPDARDAMTAAPGNWSKDLGPTYATYSRTYGGSVQFDIALPREAVCRKVVTGTKIVPAQPERTEETFEWVCDDAADAS